VRSAFASDLSLSSLRDIAESDLRCCAPDAEPKEPKPPDGFAALDADDEEEDDERCDENPLLKEVEPEGLASAGTCASGRIRLSANATRAYFWMDFSMVRSAVES
jgi:hypothetical protein